MSKGDRTRTMILERSMEVFSQRGYGGTSLSDLMRATGLEKGGLYNHFPSKDAIALAAFDHAAETLRPRFTAALTQPGPAAERLYAFVAAFRANLAAPLIPGGCPVMNAAIDADDTHPELRARALGVVEGWHHALSRIVEKGIASGEMRPDTDPAAIASLTIAAVEGAVMVARLTEDLNHFDRVASSLQAVFASLQA
ncbi:TetR/AcrR family transcriptional regulator [Deinococcus hopiensis]|uniref:Transcriptional regulator, TetR family n=1 Tax=Deinococcus hopiensis KR-140 TaxID=695939 RepID=A0A1W1VVM1_9DEIO|nr:TetR/AcrR family transcriptional regulator [Deinococcus hopiensis]SMB97425.1 transcriptional regulator, TetR family [Deinococcus hopiensis KR-140]